jgi:hypothetical protein
MGEKQETAKTTIDSCGMTNKRTSNGNDKGKGEDNGGHKGNGGD